MTISCPVLKVTNWDTKTRKLRHTFLFLKILLKVLMGKKKNS